MRADIDPCPKGDPECETGDDGSCHDGCEAPTPTCAVCGYREQDITHDRASVVYSHEFAASSPSSRS